MAKLPAFQFYPSDWLNDIKLQACSMAAQGVLINLMCLMHQSEKYGFLLINNEKKSTKTVAKLLRISKTAYEKLQKELIQNGVLKIDENGVVYCNRMVKDQELREIRKVAGAKGGNPILVNQKDNQQDNQGSNQKPTPSSSSSSSSSNKDKEPPLPPLPDPAKKKTSRFIPPTESEVIAYFHEKGFDAVLAKRAFEYYETGGWKDSKGNKVKNWKQKMLANWMVVESKTTHGTTRGRTDPTPRTYAQHQDAEMRDRATMLLEEMQNDAEMSQDGTAEIIDLLPEPEKKSTGIGYPGYSVGGGYGSDR